MTLEETLAAPGKDADRVLIPREARDQLEALHPRQSEVIRLHYIVGLTEDETA